jgi:hypothetical protein
MSVDTAIKILEAIKKSTLAKEFNKHYIGMVGEHLKIPNEEMKQYTFANIIDLISKNQQSVVPQEKKSLRIYVPIKRLIKKISIPVQIDDTDDTECEDSDEDDTEEEEEEDVEPPKNAESIESIEEWAEDEDDAEYGSNAEDSGAESD